MVNEFEEIVNKYNNDLIQAFDNIINDATKVAKENELDSIKTFIYINEEIENGFKRLLQAKDKTYIENQMPIDYNVYIKIICYLDEYLDNALNEFKELNDEIINAKSFDEFLDKKRKLIEIISNPIIRKYKELFEGTINQNNKIKVK